MHDVRVVMTQMILDFIWVSSLVGFSLVLFLMFIYFITQLNKKLLNKQFSQKGIKIKCIKWQPLKAQTLFSRKFYVVEYIKKDGRVCKTRLKSILFL
jgi:hypothetical protein